MDLTRFLTKLTSVSCNTCKCDPTDTTGEEEAITAAPEGGKPSRDGPLVAGEGPGEDDDEAYADGEEPTQRIPNLWEERKMNLKYNYQRMEI